MSVKIVFPDYYEKDELAQFEAESKGYLYGVKIEIGDKQYELVFYDPVRLKQDAEGRSSESNYFHEPNLIILNRVNKESIEKAVFSLIENGEVGYLLSD